MPTPPAPTLEDVAQRAGVSTATVSRCLNDSARVAAATRERVEAAIAALGYAPNAGARALVTRRSGIVGAVIPTLASAIFARAVEAFQAELAGAGYTLLLASSAYDGAAEARQVHALVARGVDALLLVGAQRERALYRFLQQRRIPFVVGWTTRAPRGCAAVGFDNAAATEALAQRALALGHRRFGFIAAPIADNDRARERVAGVRRALDAAGLDGAAMPVREVPYELESAGQALDELLGAAQPPTVVMCGNDVQAAGALCRALERGLSVPGELSITGFDDLEHARLVSPGLTTVHVPHREMGRRAAALLLAELDGARPRRRVALAAPLVERGSLGPAPRRRRRIG